MFAVDETYTPDEFFALFLQPFAGDNAYAEELPLDDTIDPFEDDQLFYSFWEDVVNQATLAGVIQTTTTSGIDEYGEEYYTFSSEVTDDAMLDEIFTQTVYDHLNNPASEEDKAFANFQKNLFIEGILDVDTLMDSTAPVIGGVTPADGSLAVGGAAPTISAIVEDLPGLEVASGIDPASISITLDGTPVVSEYIPEMKMAVYTPPIPLASGNHQVSLSVEDMANNQATKTWSFAVDATPPTTTATLDPASPNGLNGWYVSPVGVTLTAVDEVGGSGVDKTEYSLNDGQSWSTYEIPLIVATQGENKILFHSMDKAGNQESPNKVVTFKIDSLPPESPLIISPPDGVSLDSPVNVCGTAESMSLVKIYADGVETSATQADLAGNWQVSLNLTEESHVLAAIAKDEAGNTSTLSQPVNIFIRYQTTMSVDPGNPSTSQYSDPVTFSASLTSSQGPVVGKNVVFHIGSQQSMATTDTNGVAMVTIVLDQQAGTYPLEAVFAGDNTYTDCSSVGSFDIEKEDIILTYLGDTIASTVGSAVLKAQFTDADSKAPVSNKPVSFSVGGQSLEAVTDAAGIATGILVINQTQGVYEAEAAFAGDDYYLTAMSPPSYFVVFDPFSGQKVTGGGWLATGIGKANFGFNAEYKSGAIVPTGELQYKDHGTGLTVHSTGFSWLVFSGNYAILSGLATVNGIGGYTFRFEVSDLGEPGKNTDRFMISVMDSQGTEVYNIAGLINQGNIQVH